MSVIIFMFQSWRKLHDHNDSNMLPWKEEHWCKFVCSIICCPIHVLPLIYPCCYLLIELDTNPTGWSSKVPATSDVSAYFCSFSGCDSLLKEKIVEWGLGQTSNVSWVKPNSNLGRPKLSWERLSGQTSNLGRVKLMNWIVPKSNFNKFSLEQG